jgi:ABC-type dipeptide/oligopeptide/nickel transport system ATPase component
MKPHPAVLKDPTLNDMWEYVHDLNRNLLIALVGAPGSGKSYTGLRLAELFDEAFRNAKSIDEIQKIVDSRIVTHPKDFARVIKEDDTLKPGSVLLMDEAGIQLSYEKWQSLNNVLTSHILQSFRNRHLIVLFTMPNMKFLSIQARRLLHYLIDVQGIDFRRKKTICNVKRYQTNVESGKIYRHTPRDIVDDCRTEFNIFEFNKVSELIAKSYENKISQFKDDVTEDVFEQLDTIEKKEEEKRKREKKIDFEGLTKDVLTKLKNKSINKATTPELMTEYPFLSREKADIVRHMVKRAIKQEIRE